MIEPSIFRPYNIRGMYPDQLNEDVAYLVGQAFAKVTKAIKVAVGRDARLSGPSLQEATMQGILDFGVEVADLGVITTDQLYYASGAKDLGGIQVSASHNPPEWNGMKFMKKGGFTLTDEELEEIYSETKTGKKEAAPSQGKKATLHLLPDYIDFLIQFVDSGSIKPFRVVANPLNGTAGPVVTALAKKLQITLVPLNMEPDGHFPRGTPDPFVPAMRTETSETVKKEKADLGISWDNDADRAVFFDETGAYIPGAFTAAMLAKHLLQKYPGAKVVSECGILWPVKEAVEAAGGVHILNRRGQVFLKQRMREEGAIYCGENSGHQYFQDFWYADNGFIPLLHMLTLLSESGKKLSELVAPLRERYFFTEEINFPLESPDKLEPLFQQAEETYKDGFLDRIGGFSATFHDWRFHLHPSDNEPKLRLLVEARNQKLLDAKTAELTDFVKKFG